MNQKHIFSFLAALACLTLTACNDTTNAQPTISLSGPQNVVYIGADSGELQIPISVYATPTSQRAQNIHLTTVLPTGMTITYQSADGSTSPSSCANTPAGQSCTLILNANSNVTTGNFTLIVAADNTSPIPVNLNVQWPQLALSTSGNTNTAYTLQLTNASQVPVTGLDFSLPSTPNNWTVDTSTQSCTAGQTLAANQSCILAAISNNTQGDPAAYDITVSGSNMQATQLLSAFSPYCANNISNFDNEISQAPYYTTPAQDNIDGDIAWGPNALRPISADATLLQCASNPAWVRQRVVATADYWIGQKVNYCHHHIPTWAIPSNLSQYKNSDNYSTANNAMTGSLGYGTQVRWNYNGSGNETAAYWQTTGIWQGLDCSDYTGLIYNFGFEALLDTNVAWQAGQYYYGGGNSNTWPSWVSTLTPNQQTSTEYLLSPNDRSTSSPINVGALVCADGTPDRTAGHDAPNLCAGHGGYISMADSQGHYSATPYTGEMLASVLKPGDLIYFGIAPGPVWSPSVVHVMMWTGKRVGYGVNDINPSQIAPEEYCPESDWQPQIGDWVITDSHYQGPDYRLFTSCYYGKNLWGVRRIIDIAS